MAVMQVGVGERKPWVVAIVYTHLPSDGRVLRAATACAARGLRVTLLAPRCDRPDFSRPGVDIVWLPVDNERAKTTVAGQVRFMRAVKAWAEAAGERPDIVHVHNMPDYLYWAVKGWHREGARVVLDVHDVMSELALHRFSGLKRHAASRALRLMQEAVWRRVDHVVTVSDAYRDIIVDSGVDPESVSIVLNVPDPDECRAEMRRAPSPGAFKVVYHGTVSQRTGVVHAVRAMPRLLEAVPNARLVIIGGGNGSGDVWRAIDEFGIGDAVQFLDRFVPMAEVIPHICDAHAGVVPNETSAFTRGILPVKLLEYCTLGIPSVATRLPLIERYVGSESAWLVDRPDPALIAEGLIRIATDAELRERFVRGGRRFAVEHGWERYSEVLVDALVGSAAVPV